MDDKGAGGATPTTATTPRASRTTTPRAAATRGNKFGRPGGVRRGGSPARHPHARNERCARARDARQSLALVYVCTICEDQVDSNFSEKHTIDVVALTMEECTMALVGCVILMDWSEALERLVPFI